LAAFGYVFQVNTETVPQGSDITFSNNGFLNGITHATGTAQIGITISGIYNISFGIYTSNNNPQDWEFFVNGAAPPITTIANSEFNNSGQTLNGVIQLALNAGDFITLRNIATLPNPAILRTTNTISAYVSIYWIGQIPAL
jgi:hypothetical protein